MAAAARASGASMRPVPVFYDPTGKRLRHFVMGLVVLCSCTAIIIVIVTPYALAPLWRTQSNGSNDFPRQFLAQASLDDMPIIGDIHGGILDRIVKVEYSPEGDMLLVDPFSGQLFRTVTDEAEKEQIGESPYALDNFGRPADHTLMLTFDDGPDAKYTPELLDLLSKEHVPATFFVIGESIVKNPDVFKRIVREGHMVGNHTMSHLDFDNESDVRNREELIATDRIMRATANYSSRLFRIPTGNPASNVLAVMQSQQLGYLQVDMDLDPRDWEKKPGEAIDVPQLDGHGHVVLLHDGGGDRSATLDMVARFIASAKAQGYTFSTIEPLLPAEYVPVKNTSPALADVATLRAFQLAWIAPGKVLTGLFWFGVISLSTVSLFYMMLAILFYRQSRVRRWPRDYPAARLPFVSVVLAAYNEEKVIARTIASLRQSDYPHSRFEVIVVNDGSTDRTSEVLRRCREMWPSHLTVINKPNAGKSIAVNTGVRRARGSVIVTLDADTIFRPDTIRLLARHFVVNTHGKKVGAVAGHVKVGNRGNVLTWWQSLEYVSGICVTRIAEGMLEAISIVPGACSAWRRSALLEIGGFSESTLAEDADATLMIQKLGYRVLQENKAIAQTEAPESIRALAKQRKRWTYGNIQALWKHRGMLLRPKYGMLGMVTMPYALLSLLIPLLFLPLTVIVAVLSISEGNWKSVALFAVFVAAIHAVMSIVALVISGESIKHLLVVPVYRLIYEPLRAYLLYASVYRAIKGTVVKWDKLERRNSVVFTSPTAIPAAR